MIDQTGGTLQEQTFVEELKQLMFKHGVVMEINHTTEQLGPVVQIRSAINVRQIREVQYDLADTGENGKVPDEDLG